MEIGLVNVVVQLTPYVTVPPAATAALKLASSQVVSVTLAEARSGENTISAASSDATPKATVRS
jgi:hypothetical protein